MRLSGPRAFEILAALVPGARPLDDFPPRMLKNATLVDENQNPLDNALIVRFPKPGSFSGEDVVEFHIHGSGFIAGRLLDVLIANGARQALPGEFSFRAVRNGKMTLSQAESIADLIAASNDQAVSLALEKLSGAQNKLVTSVAEELRRVAVLAEAGIDFSDQDIDELALPQLKARLEPILKKLTDLQEGYERGSRIQHGVGVAFIGVPNAGKSSFFNALLGEDRSIVSEEAGTTRDVVREHITLRGKRGSVTLRLEDTAGLRHADNVVERMGIDRTRQAAKDADLLLLIADGTGEPHALREQWLALGAPEKKAIAVITKSDIATPIQLAAVRHELNNIGIQNHVTTSAVTGAGISEAVQSIVSHCEGWLLRQTGELLLTRRNHQLAVTKALEDLRRAQNATESDLFASDIRQTLHSLGPLIGETLSDDILGTIFSDFCIGK